MSTSRETGSLYGALVGDALGVPVEFMDRAAVQRDPVTGMRGFGTHNQPAGTWSDDSSLLLCTVESLVESRGYDAPDLATRFCRWLREAHWTPHGRVFDVGIATRGAIELLVRGTPPEDAGGAHEHSNGNGSLMRILPIAHWLGAAGPAAIIEHAFRASTLTHRHPRSQLACALYCLVIHALHAGQSPREALSTALAQLPPSPERHHFAQLENDDLARLPESAIRSSGYVVHTLVASLWCLITSSSFEETVLKAVNLGEDTDTTGCVAGGLAGACYGFEAIPPPWVDALARRREIDSLFTRFLSARAQPCP